MSNLATMLMEGANAYTPETLYGDFDFSATAVAESEYMGEACAELFSGIMEADHHYMVADVVATATIIHENANGGNVDVQAVSEGIIKDGVARLVAAFKKFIAKIKEFYKRVIDWFKAMFSKSSDFVSKFGSKMKDKAKKVKGFEYKGFKYKIAAGDTAAEGFAAEVKKLMVGTVDGIDFAKEGITKDELSERLRNKGVITGKFDDEKAPSTTDAVEKVISSKGPNGASNAAELREELVKKYTDDETAKVVIKDFEGNSVDSMLAFLKDANTKISKFQGQLKSFESSTDSIIKKLNGIKAADDSKEESAIVSNASYISSFMSAYLNLYRIPCDVQISMYKTISKEWLGAMKGFYNYKGNKPVKESVELDLDSYATLESTLVLEGCGDGASDCGGKGEGSEKDEKDESATESALSSILEAANAYI